MIKTTVDNVESNLDRYLNLVSSQDIHITKNGKVIAILTKPKEEYSIDKLVGIISNSDITFGDRVFYGNAALEEIYNLSSFPQSIGNLSFTFVNKELCKLFVPLDSYNAYREHIVWGQFNNIIEVETSINEVILENVTINTYYGGISVISNDLVNIEIFNLTGQKIYQSTFLGSKEIPLDKGVYIIGINGKNSKIIIK